jgi:hypothetical protein
MEWEECLKGKMRKRKPNPEEARALFKMAERRQRFIDSVKDRREFASLLAEDYFEIIKELVTALMSLDGYKCYSHECLVAFLTEFHKVMSRPERELIDQLRKIRSDINYRGLVLEYDYIERNEEAVLDIIRKLKGMIKGRLE